MSSIPGDDGGGGGDVDAARHAGAGTDATSPSSPVVVTLTPAPPVVTLRRSQLASGGDRSSRASLGASAVGDESNSNSTSDSMTSESDEDDDDGAIAPRASELTMCAVFPLELIKAIRPLATCFFFAPSF